MPQTEDIEYIKKYEAYDCINTSEDDDFDPLDELYEPDPVEIQNTSQNPFTAKVFDPETMLFDLAETRKTETKFRENILSLMFVHPFLYFSLDLFLDIHDLYFIDQLKSQFFIPFPEICLIEYLLLICIVKGNVRGNLIDKFLKIFYLRDPRHRFL